MLRFKVQAQATDVPLWEHPDCLHWEWVRGSGREALRDPALLRGLRRRLSGRDLRRGRRLGLAAAFCRSPEGRDLLRAVFFRNSFELRRAQRQLLVGEVMES